MKIRKKFWMSPHFGFILGLIAFGIASDMRGVPYWEAVALSAAIGVLFTCVVFLILDNWEEEKRKELDTD